MRFSLLLLALHFMLKRAAKKNSAFKHYIRNMAARILIKTEDGKRGRLFIFDKGTFSSKPGDQKEFDVALVWKDYKTAFSAMLDKRPDASFRAAAEKKIRVVGMSLYAKWFEDAMKLVL